MTEQRVFERVAYDETDWPLRWVVRVDDTGYHCEEYGLSDEDSDAWERAQNGEGPFPNPINLPKLSIAESFATSEAARKRLSTEFDSRLARHAYDFFEQIEPALYSLDRIQSDALSRILPPCQSIGSVVRLVPTHVLNYITAGEIIHLWAIIAAIPANRFFARVWHLNRAESERLLRWTLDVDEHLSSSPTLKVPTFDRSPDDQGEFTDPESFRRFLAGSHPDLGMSANEAMHLPLPKVYPAATNPPSADLDLFALTR